MGSYNKNNDNEELKQFVDDSKRIGFVQSIKTAFSALFGNNDEKMDENVQKEVEALNVESAKSIKSLENKISSGGKSGRKQLEVRLKAEQNFDALQKEGVTKNKENDQELEK